MIRRPPRSTLSSSSAASDVYKRQVILLAESPPEVVTVLAARMDWISWIAFLTLILLRPLISIVAEGLAPAGGSSISAPDFQWVSPVSYTHLRAHETPEHLVCRLLLEKKKKTSIASCVNLILKIQNSYRSLIE
eukprot:TRINITY_DN65165_c0_g1_i1.p1 TRINITY_DN65165_c0_g1~~TRINITY_DN65165_c0_g1_i1.p1  ORF type:complete len:134 (-),score=17.36 TRINITY_DN65165_c0_g1_i1:7-408(-)